MPKRITIERFRAMPGPFCGEILVTDKLPQRRGRARGINRHKGAGSRPSLAGPGDGSGPTDGGSAQSSYARSSDRTTGAGSADGQGEESKRALVPGEEQWAPKMEYPESQIQAIKKLSATRWEYVDGVNDGVDMTAVARELLGDKDSKVRLRMLERLLDILDSVDWKDSRARESNRGLGGGWSLPRPERD